MSDPAATVRPMAKKNGSNGGTDRDLLVRILARLDVLEESMHDGFRDVRKDIRELRQAWVAGHLNHERRLQQLEKRR